MKLKDEILFNLLTFIRKSPNEVVIPNIYFGRYEMDVFRFTPSGFVTEYEIKTTRADFRNDFKKSKTIQFSKNDSFEVTKHEEIESGLHNANKFYFVVPDGLVKPEEVPKNCGLIYYKGKEFKIVKTARFINKKNHLEGKLQDLIKLLSYREFTIRLKNISLLKEIENLKKNL